MAVQSGLQSRGETLGSSPTPNKITGGDLNNTTTYYGKRGKGRKKSHRPSRLCFGEEEVK